MNIPHIGLGTWQLNGQQCRHAVSVALQLGYRHIDTAMIYANQKDIGVAIKESKIARRSLFITSKVWHSSLSYADVLSQTEEILEQLQTSYLDLLLIHWPNKRVSMKETFKALAELVEAGKVKHIGVSNFTIQHLKEAMKVSSVPLYCCQFEFHPYLQQHELVQFCKQNGIVVTAYSPLAQGHVLEDPEILKIAHKHKKTVAQIVLAWIHQQDIVVIPKSTTKERLEQNLKSMDIELSSEEIHILRSLNMNKRYCAPAFAEF